MSYRLYPISGKEFVCEDYRVWIDGKEVSCDAARVSAHPLNRRWPGCQRQLEQTEMINFLSLAMDSPITMEIVPPEPFDSVMIRPQSAEIRHEVTAEGSILIHLDQPRYFTVEPYGRNRALHIFADAMPAYAVKPMDENVIYFGQGVHEAGTIELQSNQTLYLDEGAVVYACVKAFDVENIRILGRGILDNSHNKEQILFEAHEQHNDSAVKNAKRQHTIQLEYCRGVEIDGITIRDSLVYNIRPIACQDLTIRNVKIVGCWRFNSDGIDMHNCENVLIENCFIRTFDDSICVKGFDCYHEKDVEQAVYEAMHYGGGSYENFRHVRVRGCVIWNDWGRALEIGAETRAEEITDVIFEDCDVIHVTSAVLDCQNVDYADVHDITYRNIRIELDQVIPKSVIQQTDDQKYEIPDPDFVPPLLCSKVAFHHEYSAGGTRRGRNRDILFENIDILGRQKPRFTFIGHSEEACSRDIVMRNICHNGRKLTSPEEYVLEMDEFCYGIRME